MFNVAGGGNIRMMDDQAEWIAELVCGDLGLPEPAEMRKVMEEEQAYLHHHFPGSPRYALELDPDFYRKQLARERRRGGTRPRRAAGNTQASPTMNKESDRVAA